MEKQHARTSKFLSLVLRHKPEEIGLTLHEGGWAYVAELITKMNAKGEQLTPDILQFIVDNNDKKRFAFNDDKTMIRASQGHSVEVDLDLPEAVPPDVLYHGTSSDVVEAVVAEGIQRRSRHHVHLSVETNTAVSVGGRHGKPVLLRIDAKAMHAEGFKFYVSANGVWLTDEVPARFIRLIK